MPNADRPDGLDAAAFDAVVWDLDGTLVHLAVDWEAVATDEIGRASCRERVSFTV